MNKLSIFNYLVSFFNVTLSRGFLSLNVRSNKITILLSSDLLRVAINFLSKSTVIKANSLLDIGLLIIRNEKIDLKLIIYVICKK